jgi:hypothetical protein
VFYLNFGFRARKQGCQMVCFQTKSPNLGKFCRVLQWKMLIHFMDTWLILRFFVIFYVWTSDIASGNLVYFSPRIWGRPSWYIFLKGCGRTGDRIRVLFIFVYFNLLVLVGAPLRSSNE